MKYSAQDFINASNNATDSGMMLAQAAAELADLSEKMGEILKTLKVPASMIPQRDLHERLKLIHALNATLMVMHDAQGKPVEPVEMLYKDTVVLPADSWYTSYDVDDTKPNTFSAAALLGEARPDYQSFLPPNNIAEVLVALENWSKPGNLTFSQAIGNYCAQVIRKAFDLKPTWCTKPPKGWVCNRGAEHDGPCAAYKED